MAGADLALIGQNDDPATAVELARKTIECHKQGNSSKIYARCFTSSPKPSVKVFFRLSFTNLNNSTKY